MANTTRSKEQQAVLAKISGLRKYAVEFLRETERGRLDEQTQRLMADFGKHLLAFAPEASVPLK
jgi:hypothetical protein